MLPVPEARTLLYFQPRAVNERLSKDILTCWKHIPILSELNPRTRENFPDWEYHDDDFLHYLESKREYSELEQPFFRTEKLDRLFQAYLKLCKWQVYLYLDMDLKEAEEWTKCYLVDDMFIDGTDAIIQRTIVTRENYRFQSFAPYNSGVVVTAYFLDIIGRPVMNWKQPCEVFFRAGTLTTRKSMTSRFTTSTKEHPWGYVNVRCGDMAVFDGNPFAVVAVVTMPPHAVGGGLNLYYLLYNHLHSSPSRVGDSIFLVHSSQISCIVPRDNTIVQIEQMVHLVGIGASIHMQGCFMCPRPETYEHVVNPVRLRDLYAAYKRFPLPFATGHLPPKCSKTIGKTGMPILSFSANNLRLTSNSKQATGEFGVIAVQKICARRAVGFAVAKLVERMNVERLDTYDIHRHIQVIDEGNVLSLSANLDLLGDAGSMLIGMLNSATKESEQTVSNVKFDCSYGTFEVGSEVILCLRTTRDVQIGEELVGDYLEHGGMIGATHHIDVTTSQVCNVQLV